MIDKQDIFAFEETIFVKQKKVELISLIGLKCYLKAGEVMLGSHIIDTSDKQSQLIGHYHEATNKVQNSLKQTEQVRINKQ